MPGCNALAFSMPEKIDITYNFISVSDEAALLEQIAKIVPPNRSPNQERNAILRFGSAAPYDDHIISETIPQWLEQFHSRIDFNHVTINEYYRGQEIPWHIDSKGCGEVITVLSLMSDQVVKFRKGMRIENYTLPSRSLVQFSGLIRWEWEHYLYATAKRYSIVFRNGIA